MPDLFGLPLPAVIFSLLYATACTAMAVWIRRRWPR